MAIRRVRVADIELVETDSRLRVDVEADYLEDLTAFLRESDDPENLFPPVALFVDPRVGRYYVGDGYYRIEAHMAAGLRRINAEVTYCSDPRFESFVCAAGANADHGLRRSGADRIHAARLARREFPLYPMTEIADLIGVPKAWMIRTRKRTDPSPPGMIQANRRKRLLALLSRDDIDAVKTPSRELADWCDTSHSSVCKMLDHIRRILRQDRKRGTKNNIRLIAQRIFAEENSPSCSRSVG